MQLVLQYVSDHGAPLSQTVVGEPLWDAGVHRVVEPARHPSRTHREHRVRGETDNASYGEQQSSQRRLFRSANRQMPMPNATSSSP
jgi:hypothetical protein